VSARKQRAERALFWRKRTGIVAEPRLAKRDRGEPPIPKRRGREERSDERRKRTGIEPEKRGVVERDQGRSREDEVATDGGSARNVVDREGACDSRVRFVLPGDASAVGIVETALAYAIIAATEARQWGLVAQLAKELEARRRAREADGVVHLSEVTRERT
jgi:hypothetical protein